MKRLAEPTASFPNPSHGEWTDAVRRSLKGRPVEPVLRRTDAHGLTQNTLYTAGDVPSPARVPMGPGRGARGWLLVQTLDHPDPAELKVEASQELAGGADGLRLRLDRAARLGRTDGLGQRGSAFHRAAALADLLTCNPRLLELNAGANAAPLMALAQAAWQRSTPPDTQLHLLLDPIGALASDGVLPRDVQRLHQELARLVHTAHPRWRVLGASAEPWVEAGGSLPQALGFTLASAVHTLRSLTELGLSVDAVASQLVFTLPLGRDTFRSVAALRALRLLWARVVELSGGQESTPWVHATCAAHTHTRRDPNNNMLRVSTQAFAAVCGGADSLSTAPFDRSLRSRSPLGRRLARNTQLVLGEESGLGMVRDPAAGSWAVEALTQQLAEQAWAVFQEVEGQGGAEQALRSGLMRSALDESWAKSQAVVRRRKLPITGVSEFPLANESAPPAPVALSAETLETLHVGAPEVQGSSAQDLLEAAHSGVGLVELTRAMGETTGAIPALPRRRLAQDFEALRARAEGSEDRPVVLLATLGSEAEWTPRATFATNLLQAGGFEVALSKQADLGLALSRSGARAAVICSTDARYAESAVAACEALQTAGATRILLAGRPGGLNDALTRAGLTGALYRGCDAHGLLSTLLDASEVEA